MIMQFIVIDAILTVVFILLELKSAYEKLGEMYNELWWKADTKIGEAFVFCITAITWIAFFILCAISSTIVTFIGFLLVRVVLWALGY